MLTPSNWSPHKYVKQILSTTPVITSAQLTLTLLSARFALLSAFPTLQLMTHKASQLFLVALIIKSDNLSHSCFCLFNRFRAGPPNLIEIQN